MTLRQIFRKSRALMGSPHPLILYHKPTARCDCHCRFCDFWVTQPSEDDVLPTPKILNLLQRAYAAGMVEYTVFGGEPLLAQGLADWFQFARQLGFRTTICTAGHRLAERAPEIGPNTTSLLLSLEAVGEKQDWLRGTDGLFRRIEEGIEEFKKHSRADICLWSNISKESRDQIGALAQFARSEKISVSFFPTARFSGYNEEMLLTPQERLEVFQEVKDLKKRGFPVKNSTYSLNLMATGRSFRCNLPRLSIHVSSEGRISPCEPRLSLAAGAYGTVDDVDLNTLRSSPEYRRNWEQLLSCNNCEFPCVTATCDHLWLQALLRLPVVRDL